VTRRISFTTCSAGFLTGPDFCPIFAPSMATMGQKSSLLQLSQSVSWALMPDMQLKQAHAAAGVLDDDEIDLPLRHEREDLLAHLHDRPVPAADLEDMEGLVVDPDHSDRGVIIVGAGFAGRITAQQDAMEILALWRSVVTREPSALNHVAVSGRRVLLVLGSKNPAADFRLQLLHCRGTVSPGLQQFPGGAMVYLILAH